ncbi:hypothetical protein FF38_06131 [Lucilia cuprina]|uniref:Uncharacterized protein n=1 Tax=Lucilia cuprina TaxID=7375 RepID=A0A0L0C6Q3_LUCCU|nr:hypothetical protein FF38_06131 [Lucilia cuprina]
MERSSYLNIHLQRLKYYDSFCNKCKRFIPKNLKNKQRLIPLTREIEKAMMDFNGSQSNTSISEKPIYNTLSITGLVRDEVQNILQELSISDQFIRKEEIDDLIEKRLKEKVTIIQDSDAKTNHLILRDFDINQEFEMTVEEMSEDKDKSMLIVENIQILEQRITTLEERLSSMLQNIPKLRHIQARRFKINTSAIKEELRNMIQKMEKLQEEQTVASASLQDVNDKEKSSTLYDDIYYANREYTINLLNYKKSLETMELNRKPKFNPYVKPVNIVLPAARGKIKQRPVFLTSSDICLG